MQPDSPEMRVHDFLGGLAESVGALLPEQLRDFQERIQGSLLKIHYDDPSQHYEVWLRRSAGFVELGLHFESRDRERNSQMLEWFADEILWIKAALDERIEAEPWDRGWTRVHRVLPVHALDLEFQQSLAEQLARTIELLEPVRREAEESLVGPT